MSPGARVAALADAQHRARAPLWGTPSATPPRPKANAKIGPPASSRAGPQQAKSSVPKTPPKSGRAAP
eukprot:13816005-Alexandrium_andersonii.AAC.1